ncbi:MAG: TolC family protein [Verrucomicrobiales bacterium]|nr:TolC family protein [Verrucomicrobiales bacterium]
MGAGCSTSHYRKAADEQVYGIIQTVEGHVFGRTNAFTIDTRWSARDPKEISPEELLQDRTGTNLLVLNLEQMLELAVGSSRNYQSQKEQLYLTALNLTGQQHRFTPQFFGSLTPQIAGNGSGELSGSLNPQVGFSQFLKSGGNFSVQLVNDLFRYYTGDPRESVMSVLSVNVAQPLLQGFGKNSDAVESLTQSQREVVYAVRSFAQYQRQFDVDIVNDYFSLLGLKDTVRNNYTNYLRKVDTTKYVEARSVDRARRSEVDDARASELGARISYINSVASYLSQMDAFKITLGLPISYDLYLDDQDLADLDQAGLIPVDVDRRQAFGLAVETHADVLNAIDQFEDRKRKIELAADKLKTAVTLIGSASYRANERVDYTTFNPDAFNYGVGLQIDLPFDRLSERNAYRTTLVQFEQQLRSLGLTLDQFKDRIDRGLRTLEQRRLNYLNRQAQLDVNRRRVEQSQILLEAGRANIRDLREAQDLLIIAQNDLTSTRVDYLQARLQLLLDMGIIRTEEAQFWLRDPLVDMSTEGDRGVNPLKMPGDELRPPDEFLEFRHEAN